MKIVLITDLYLPNVGGVEIVVYNLAKEFKNRGHKVTIIAARSPRNLAQREVIKGIDVYRLDFILPAFRLKSIFGFFTLGIITNIKLLMLLRKIDPDMVNSHFVYANGFYTLLAKKVLKCPLVVSLHGNDVQRFPLESKICSWILKNLLNSADFVTACSASLLDEAMQIVPEIKDKALSIPNGIDLQEFELKEKYIYEKPYIFSIGRFVHKKGFDILIKAFKKVVERNDKIDLVIAGDGEEWEKCVRLIDELQIKKRVKLLGFVSRKEIIKLYNGCEFFVLPSRKEPFGITNLEAMAAGKAVVAANVDGVSEIIQDGKNGILVKPENPINLAEKICWLLENEKERNLMEQRGRYLIKNISYNWKCVAKDYLGLYNIQKTEVDYEKTLEL